MFIFKKFTAAILIIMTVMILGGCTKIDDLEVKYGWKNRDFEYIKENKVNKIIIQSTRDTGFRFIVTDQRTITELYDILSTAKAVSEKSSLEPDYIFEMYEDDTVHKFMYIAGLDKQNLGNLYSDNQIFIVSKRIDNDIVRNLWNIRKPREFQNVYYKSILLLLEKYGKDINKGGKVGIDLSEDIDVAKYMLSTDLEEFKANLKQVMGNAEMMGKDKEAYDARVTVKTYGYKSEIYKSIITVYNKNDKSETKYYVMDRYENGEWNLQVSNTKPETF